MAGWNVAGCPSTGLRAGGPAHRVLSRKHRQADAGRSIITKRGLWKSRASGGWFDLRCEIKMAAVEKGPFSYADFVPAPPGHAQPGGDLTGDEVQVERGGSLSRGRIAASWLLAVGLAIARAQL